MNGLLTDLYELTMAAGYFEAGKAEEIATFEFTIRRFPHNRNFVIAAGLPQAVDYLLNLSFSGEEIDYLRGLPQFRHAPPAFFDYLRDFRFTGDLFAVPEGTPLFAGEPMLTVRAPIIEAQIPETYLLSAITFPTLIASKAARCVEAAAGRAVVEFGTRRAHTPEAGVLGARAAYLGGCAGTSNTLAGMRFGVPGFRHVGAFLGDVVRVRDGSVPAFAAHAGRFDGAIARYLRHHRRRAARRQSSASRCGECASIAATFAALSRQVRGILDEAGLHDAKIMASGDLDEYKIRDLVHSRRAHRRVRRGHATRHLRRCAGHGRDL